MSRPQMLRVAATVAAAAVTGACQGGGESAGGTLVDEVQALLLQAAANAPDELAQGKELFGQNCSVCHGPAADGTALGPPLAHTIYEPRHHADAAFMLAVKIGVRSHHWRFGDMKPLPQVTEAMIQEITAYVRWLQRQVGID